MKTSTTHLVYTSKHMACNDGSQYTTTFIAIKELRLKLVLLNVIQINNSKILNENLILQI